MKIQYNGDHTVDIPGADLVEPGSIVEVDDEVGASLLLAGSAVERIVDIKGVEQTVITPPAAPLWTKPNKTAPAPADSASAVKES